jgi:hypothetical protein
MLKGSKNPCNSAIRKFGGYTRETSVPGDARGLNSVAHRVRQNERSEGGVAVGGRHKIVATS